MTEKEQTELTIDGYYLTHMDECENAWVRSEQNGTADKTYDRVAFIRGYIWARLQTESLQAVPEIDFAGEAYDLASSITLEDLDGALNSFNDNDTLECWLRSFTSRILQAERAKERGKI